MSSSVSSPVVVPAASKLIRTSRYSHQEIPAQERMYSRGEKKIRECTEWEKRRNGGVPLEKRDEDRVRSRRTRDEVGREGKDAVCLDLGPSRRVFGSGNESEQEDDDVGAEAHPETSVELPQPATRAESDDSKILLLVVRRTRTR